MVVKDKEEQAENIIDYLDYLASFWSPESVKKIREKRAKESEHNFQSDEEFEKYVVESEFKNTQLADLLKKIKERDANKFNSIKPGENRKLKLPENINQSIIGDLIGKK